MSAAETTAKTMDLGYVAWEEPYAWMESMRGPRWQRFVAQENAAFEEAVRAVAEKEEVEAALTAFKAAEEEADVGSKWILHRAGVKITAVPRPGGAWECTWESEARGIVLGDIDISPEGLVAYTQEMGDGSDKYRIVVQDGRKILWEREARRHSREVAVLGGRLYSLEGERPLQFTRLVSFDVGTGRGRRVLYEEDDSSVMLSLLRTENQGLFLLGDNAGRQVLHWVRPTGEVEPVGPGAVAFYPLGLHEGRPAYLYKERLGAAWKVAGVPGWKLRGDSAGLGIEVASLARRLVIWKDGGERLVGERHIFASFEMDPWSGWWSAGAGTAGGVLVATVPGRSPQKVLLQGVGELPQEGLKAGWARSADGTRVRWLVVGSGAGAGAGGARGLMMTVYGSYGVSTRLSTARWKPYLDRGWAIGFAFVRGGGDGSLEWAEAGRREGKARSVDDFVACVAAARDSLGIPAERTCIYGRSAGGFIVGAAVARAPRGDLFGAAYCEVPYVDALATASEPALPLTEYEYLEFGNPRRNIADLETLLRNGPITALGAEGAPGVFVVCRTGTSDQHVYAYESGKWILALRGAASTAAQAKLLAIDIKGGHFILGSESLIQHTEDFLLLSKKCLG